MEKQFPGAGKSEPGGAKVIFYRSFDCTASRLGNGVSKDPTERVKDRRTDFNNGRAFAGDLLLITSQNPFAERKTFPNRGATQLLPTGEIDEKIDALVTTSHVFWPNQRRRVAFSLPIWRPISNALGGKSKRKSQRGGGGGQPGAAGQKCSIDTLTRKFLAIGSPAQFLLKKNRTPNSEHFEPSRRDAFT